MNVISSFSRMMVCRRGIIEWTTKHDCKCKAKAKVRRTYVSRQMSAINGTTPRVQVANYPIRSRRGGESYDKGEGWAYVLVYPLRTVAFSGRWIGVGVGGRCWEMGCGCSLLVLCECS